MLCQTIRETRVSTGIKALTMHAVYPRSVSDTAYSPQTLAGVIPECRERSS